MKYHVPILILVFLLFLGGVAAIVANQPVEDRSQPAVGGIAIGGDFTLVDQDGRTVTNHSWPGHYLLVYFGFTHCPDMCPTDLSKIAEVMTSLPASLSKKIQPLFITLDPARDTPAAMQAYVTAFHGHIIGLTGTEAQIDKVKTLYRVYSEKSGNGRDYTVNHSGFMYLMAPTGENAALFDHEMTAQEIAKDIRAAVH